MMSTAILMAMGADQTSVRPVGKDGKEADGISFAQSFDERVGVSAEMLGKSSTSEIPPKSQSMNDEPAMKTTNLVATVSRGVKGRTTAEGEEADYGEVKGEVGGKTVTPQKVTVSPTAPVPQTKVVVRDLGSKDVQSPAEVEPAEDSPGAPSQIATQDAINPSLNEKAFLTEVNAAEEQPPVPSSGEVVVQKGAAKTAKALDAPTKKTTKSLQNEGEPTSSQKIATTQHPVAITVKPTSSSVAQTPLMTQPVVVASTPAIVASATSKSEVSTTADGVLGGDTAVALKTPLEGTIDTKESLVRKDVADGKTPEVDVEKGLSFASDVAGSEKPVVGIEKLSGSISTSDDVNVKSVSGSGTAIAIAHAMTGSIGGASAVAAPGNASSDPNVMKLPPAEAGSHTTGLPAGLREEDGSGAVGGSMDGMPQMLTATPTALEVGIQNGTHGWLKVRAEMADGGVVNASVSAASTTGQEMLHRELPALTAFLQSEKVAVNTIAVHPTAPESRGGGANMDGGSGGQTQQGGNDQAGQQKGVTNTAFDGADEAVSYESLNGVDDDGASPLGTYVGGGSWLSVRA